MCETFLTCESIDVLMARLAVEMRLAADDLAGMEAIIAAMAADLGPDFERLQMLDRLGQQLRALEAFLSSIAMCDCGRVDVEAALSQVWLETVRKRLGGVAPAARPAAAELEVW